MKRFICMMLTLIMLVSLVPMTALTASAASYATSEAAITVLKKMTTFKSKCYRVADTQEFRIGYGTICEKDHEINSDLNGKGSTVVTDAHTISEKEADAALRKALAEMDKKVNSFASTNKLSLKQNQHDALVVFSYGVGTAWMNGNTPVKTAVINNVGINEMLSAMLTAGGDQARHKVEVNMYYNGVYSNVIPGNFAQVTYDANGGSMAQGSPYDMQFDTSESIKHVPSPLKNGNVFLGWYLNSEWMPKLTAKCANQTLVAKWQDKNLQPKDAGSKALEVNYPIAKSQLASRTVYSIPDGHKDYVVEKAEIDRSTMTVYKDYIAPDGARWAYVQYTTKSSAKGWVIVQKGSGTYSDGVDIDVTVTVTNSYLNRRVNASTASKQNGTYHKGDKVRIISTANGSGLLWGQVAESYDDNTPIGWIALMYTNWNSVKDDPEYTRDPEESNTSAIGLATVTFEGYVNLRNEPGTDNKIVGSLYKNDTVEIFEIRTVNGHQWGRTNGGWLCLTYTSLTMTSDKNVDKYVSSQGALNYTFTGKVKRGGLQPKVSPNMEAEYVEQYYIKKNDKGEVKYKVELWPEYDEDVTITNMVIASDGLWARISWRVDLDQNGKDDTTKSGWIRLDTDRLSVTSNPVSMNATKFTTVSNGITVRQEPDNAANPVSQITLNKGVQVEIDEIALTGENIWGRLDNEHIVTTGEYNQFKGWVNLATKYFSRTDLPVVEKDEGLKPIGQIAKVVGASSVNVRITGSTTAKKLGTLQMGTVANILQYSEDGKWCNLDIDVDHDPETGSWVSKQYLQISDGYTNGAGPDTGSGSNQPAPIYTGKGIVANTYAGVNVRKGAGTGYAAVGKLLPGTIVDILEVTTGGAAKWARIKEGWICMDYVTMISEDIKYPESPVTPDGSIKVDSYEQLDKTTTTAIYTGSVTKDTPIFAAPSHENVDDDGNAKDTSFVTRTANPGEKITVYELLAVKELHLQGNDNHEGKDEANGGGHGTSVEVIETSYWARVNDGYIFNPQDHIQLDALDEKVHTVSGIESLNIRADANSSTKLGDPLKQGTQVKITALKIVQDKVWGRTDIERDGTLGWIRLDYTAEGAYVVEEKPTTAPTQAPQPTIGVGDGVGGGFVSNSKGYRYKGTVTGAAQGLKVRSTPSTSGSITTTLKNGAALVIYETTSASGEAWGRCDAGWVYLYYVNMTPVVDGVIEVHTMGNNQNYTVYTDSGMSGVAGTYTRQAVVEVTEVMGDMCKTELGWVSRSDFLK